MYKKSFYFLTLIVFSLHAFASGVREEISLYAPQRMGYQGGIQSVELDQVQKGPTDNHFSLKADGEIGNVLTGHMKFDEDTVYGYEYSRGRFITFDSDTQDLVKDRISTYAIARLTFDSYKKSCKNLPEPFKSQTLKKLNTVKVSLNPNDQQCGEDEEVDEENAYYQRTKRGGQGEINFCNLSLTTASFFDIPAHETGHAILDALQPIFNDGGENHPYSAFHEAFGDLSAIFASARLAHLQGKGAALVTFLQSDKCLCIAKGWSGPTSCLRSSRDKVDGSCEAHDQSVAFTRFFGQAMKYTFKDLRPTIANAERRANAVFNYFQRLLVATALRITPTEFNSLYDFGFKMKEMAKYAFSDPDDTSNPLSIIQKNIEKALIENSVQLASCKNVEPSFQRSHLARMPWGYTNSYLSSSSRHQ